MARRWIDAVAGVLAGLLLTAAPAAAQTKAPPKPAAPSAPAPFQKTFSRPNLASEAVRLEAALKTEAGGPLAPAAQTRRRGEALLAAGKPGEALAPLTASVAADPGDPATWRSYAQAAQGAAHETEENDYQGRTRLRAGPWPPPTGPTSAPAPPPRRPRHSPCSARTRRRRRNGARRSTPTPRASRWPMTAPCGKPTRPCAPSTASAS